MRKPRIVQLRDPAAPSDFAVKACLDGVMNYPAASDFLGISRREVERLVAARQVAVVRIGRRVLIPKAELVRLLASRIQGLAL